MIQQLADWLRRRPTRRWCPNCERPTMPLALLWLGGDEQDRTIVTRRETICSTCGLPLAIQDRPASHDHDEEDQ